MGRKILIIISICLLSLVVFYVAIFITLPTEALQHFAEKTIEKALGQKQSVEIESVSISPLLNLTANGFKMTPRQLAQPSTLSLEGGTYNGFYCAPAVEEQPFIIDRLYINPSLFASLKGNYSGKFEIEQDDDRGTITGEINSKKGTVLEVIANAKDISLNEFALLSNYTKMQIYGTLDFDLRTVIEKKVPKELKTTLQAHNTALCPKRLKLDMAGLPYIDLPFTFFGNIDGDIEASGDKVTINSLTADGPDLAFDIKGEITLKSAKNPATRLDLKAIIKPSQEWLTENDMKVIYQICEKHEDGSVHLTLTGTTKRPKHDCGTPIPEPVEAIPAPAKETKEDKEQPAEAAPTQDKPVPEAIPAVEAKDDKIQVVAPSTLEPPVNLEVPRRDDLDRNRISRPTSRPLNDTERANTRMHRPTNDNPRLPPGARDRINRAIEADDAADTENRRRRHQLPPGE